MGNPERQEEQKSMKLDKGKSTGGVFHSLRVVAKAIKDYPGAVHKRFRSEVTAQACGWMTNAIPETKIIPAWGTPGTLIVGWKVGKTFFWRKWRASQLWRMSEEPPSPFKQTVNLSIWAGSVNWELSLIPI